MPPKITVRAINRSADVFTRQSTSDKNIITHAPITQENLPAFSMEKEYVRALNAAKLKRMFSQPFIRAMNDHIDGIYAMCNHPFSINTFFSGSADGSIKIYDISRGRLLQSLDATSESEHLRAASHTGWVTGLNVSNKYPNVLLSSSRDHTIKLWKLPRPERMYSLSTENTMDYNEVEDITLSSTIHTSETPNAITHNEVDETFVTPTSEGHMLLWSHKRAEPISAMSFTGNGNTDTGYSAAAFNRAETNLVAGLSETSLIFFDTRVKTGVQKFTLWSRPNCIAWNPYDPFMLAVGTNGNCAFTFDLRNTKSALDSYGRTSQVGAVLDLAFDPTGRKLALGCSDATIGIYSVRGLQQQSVTAMPSLQREKIADVTLSVGVTNDVRPNDMYHNQRMRGVWKVCYSNDSRFIISGSEDANVRVWKADASEKLAPSNLRERQTMAYRESLIEKFQSTPGVSQVLHSHRLPNKILSAREKYLTHTEAMKRRAINQRIHGKKLVSVKSTKNAVSNPDEKV